MKKRWNLATLAAACSTMGFCVATGHDRPLPPENKEADVRSMTPESKPAGDSTSPDRAPKPDDVR